MCGTPVCTDMAFKELTVYPRVHVVIQTHAWQHCPLIEPLLSLVPEADFTVTGLLTDETTLVHEVMMVPPQHDEVIETGLTALGPVLDVVTIDKSCVGAARELTSLVPGT